MKSLAFSLLLTLPTLADEADHWELTLESGYAWQVGTWTEIDYEIVPTQLTLRSPTAWTLWDGQEGAKLLVRHRLSALFETVTEGPESYYIGLAAAPSLEYWFPSQKTSAFFSIGGGFGWTDSAGGPQALGQDFTLHWFVQLGLRRKITENFSLLAGPFYQHLSNAGATDPNPAVDVLGLTIGLGWRF
ncbi:MAG: acyloxyacyl hydrolase [Luteolibacter sp.]